MSADFLVIFWLGASVVALWLITLHVRDCSVHLGRCAQALEQLWLAKTKEMKEDDE